MEKTKQNLTHLIEFINSSFPEENDLKGFPGISKALITDTLLQSDVLLVSLKEQDNLFETIILKRELSELFDKINKELEKGFENIKPNDFNSLLKNITKVRFLIRETYISLVESKPIRTEIEIAKANEELNLLRANINELKNINIDLTELQKLTTENVKSIESGINLQKDAALTKINEIQDTITALSNTTLKSIDDTEAEIKVLKESATTIVADFVEKQKSSIESEKKITEFLSNIETQKTGIELTQKNTAQWEIEISKAKEDFITNTSQYNALNLKLKSLQNDIEKAYETITGKDKDGLIVGGYLQEIADLQLKITTFLEDQTSKYSAQFSEIESLLPGATSTGLARAYQIQKSSYKRPMLLWSIAFISIMVLMTTLSAIIIYYQFGKTTDQTIGQALISLLKDLPFFIPTIWLASYASKQQSQYKRLEQEYAFKETNAKSFHGHKMQVEELVKDGVGDKDLLLQLVAQLVIITSQNPSETLDNKSHEDSPPVFKLVEQFLSLSKKKAKEENKSE